MKHELSRRLFLKYSAAAGSVIGSSLLSGLTGLRLLEAHAAPASALAVAKSQDYFKNTIKAVDLLGGMGRFVPRQAKVGLLVNNPFTNIGAHVNPDVTLALVKMCFEAGAKGVVSLKNEPRNYWSRSGLLKTYSAELNALKANSGEYPERSVPGGVSLKKAEVIKDLFEVDVFINVSIAKDHDGVKYSGLLKNMMGAATFSTCRYFHSGAIVSGYYSDVPFLSQCIADINLLRRPDLCVLDATQFISENGPYGPGRLIKAHKVVAGTDPVLMDAYGCTLLGLDPRSIIMLSKSAKAGLGRMDLTAADIQEIEI
ncbi:MAG: DUF362 domain-containing protein [Thermodesulfobacteriota bacterium]